MHEAKRLKYPPKDQCTCRRMSKYFKWLKLGQVLVQSLSKSEMSEVLDRSKQMTILRKLSV